MKCNWLKTATAITMILAASPALALDNEAVVKQLKAMQEQMNSLQQEVKSLKGELSDAKEKAATAEAKAKIAEKAAAEAKTNVSNVKSSGKVQSVTSDSDIKISMSPSPKIETADGAYSFKVGGFGQIDAGMFNDDRRDHPNGTTIRRARLNASGTIDKDFKYKLEYDFGVTPSATQSGLTDVYLEYTGFEGVSIMAGQFKEPFGLEVLTSDLFTTFMERGSINAFAPDRNIGLAVGFNGKGDIGAWTATAGGFGGNAGAASTDDEAHDVTGRLTLAPIAEKDKVLHFGIAGSHRVPDSATDSIRVQSRAENRLSSSQAVDTGALTGVDSVDLLGLEAAAVWGPASLQAEYMMADFNRATASSEGTLDGYYVEASYFLTGESRNYTASTAKFDRTKPKSPFSLKNGTWGAWQVATRYSELDLSDGGINGGKLNDITVALKWIPHSNIMVTGNYVHVNTDGAAVTPNDDPDIWMLRTQFDF